MPSEQLGLNWRSAGEALGFRVDAPYAATLLDGRVLEFFARLPDFGGRNGMLLSDSFSDFSADATILVAAGNEYSVLSGRVEPLDL